MPLVREDFDSASWTSLLTPVTSGAATVALDAPNSEVVLNWGASLGDAAFVYLNTAISTTEDKIIRVMFRTSGTGNLPMIALTPRATAPAIDTSTNLLAQFMTRMQIGTVSASRALIVARYDASSVQNQWDPTTNTWLTGSQGIRPVAQDDFHHVTLQVDGVNQRYRWLIGGAYDPAGARTNSQGMIEQTFTDWTLFSNTRSAGGLPIWLMIGFPYNNTGASASSARIEHVEVATGTREYFTMNQRGSATTYRVPAGYRLGNDKRGLLFDRQPWFGTSAATYEDTTVQMRSHLQLSDGTFRMYYSCSGTVTNGIALASFPDWETTPTRLGLIAPATAGGLFNNIVAPYAVIDMQDIPSRRYKLICACVSTTPTWQLYIYTSASADGPFVRENNPVFPLGSAGAFDDAGQSNAVVFWRNDHWEFYYAGKKSGGAWSIARATATSLTSGAVTVDGAGSLLLGQRDQIEAPTASFTGRTILMASTTGFYRNQPVLIANDTVTDANWNQTRIRNVTANANAEAYHGVVGYGTSARVLGWQNYSITPHEVRYDATSGLWELYASAFGLATPASPIVAFMETSMVFTSPTIGLGAVWTPKWESSPIVDHYSTSPGNGSIENIAFAHTAQWSAAAQVSTGLSLRIGIGL